MFRSLLPGLSGASPDAVTTDALGVKLSAAKLTVPVPLPRVPRPSDLRAVVQEIPVLFTSTNLKEPPRVSALLARERP